MNDCSRQNPAYCWLRLSHLTPKGVRALLDKRALTPFLFLLKSMSYVTPEAAWIKLAEFAQSATVSRRSTLLSPISDKFLRSRRGSSYKHLILLARILPHFAIS